MSIDWTKIFKKYKGLWVALEDDEKTVILSGKTAKQTLEKAKEKGYQMPILFRVPTKILPYVGSVLHEIILNIGGWKHKIIIGFSNDIAKSGYGILGQKSFFDIFVVKFDLSLNDI